MSRSALDRAERDQAIAYQQRMFAGQSGFDQWGQPLPPGYGAQYEDEVR